MSLTGITPIMIASMIELRIANLKDKLENARREDNTHKFHKIHKEIMVLIARLERYGNR